MKDIILYAIPVFVFSLIAEILYFSKSTTIITRRRTPPAVYRWGSIVNDISKAPDLKAGFGYIFGTPRWSHDGSRKTTEQLREEMKTSEPVKDYVE
jgi:hypothetical protein